MTEPITTPTSAPTLDGPRDRAMGALIGLATGDAVGTTLEFKAPGTFTPITDMVGGGPFALKPGQWTDDTSMALCLAASLVETGDMDLVDQLERYVRWRDKGYMSSTGRCFDIGNTTTSQLNRFLRTGEPIDPTPDQNAAANGSLMRLAPVPIRWWRDPAVAAERSAESSRTTHAAERPVDACRVLGAMIAALIGGRSSEEVFSPDFWAYGDLHPEVHAIVNGSWRDKEPPAIRGTGFCIDALEAAIWAVAGATDFRDAVLRAANLGDDADTTAAIAGQLAGARWGAGGIPREWAEKVTMVEDIASLAEQLFDAADPDHADDLGGARPSGAPGRPGSDRDPSFPDPWPHDRAIHAWWVQQDSILAGEYPGHLDRGRAVEKINLLVDAGVRTFIDLTEATEGLEPYADLVAEVAEARVLDLRHRRFPIRDISVLPEDDAYDEIVNAIRAEAERGVVFVHCWGGVGRTGTVVGCVLVDHGYDGQAALDRIAALRAGTRKDHRRAPENSTQDAVILRRASRPA